MNFKQKAVTAAVLTALSGPSLATTVADLQNPANVVIFHAGASASTRSVQEGVVLALCDPSLSTPNVFGNNAAIASADMWTVDCSAKSGLTNITAGTRIIYNKRDRDGSGVGVKPLIDGQPVGFMAPVEDAAGNCPNSSNISLVGTVTVNYFNCTGFTTGATGTRQPVGSLAATTDIILAVPQIGTSDIEPSKFTYALNTPAADLNLDGSTATEEPNPNQNNTLTANGVGILVFGVPVNLRMYQDLQRAQFSGDGAGGNPDHPLYNDCNPAGANYALASGNAANPNNVADNANLDKCMPSLTRMEISSIYAAGGAIRNIGDFQRETFYGSGAFTALTGTGTTTNAIQICRRANGSGTQAQSNAIYLGYPCDDVGNWLTPETRAVLTTFVHNNPGSGNVENCLEAYSDGDDDGNTVANSTTGIGFDNNTAIAWAIGVSSLERNANLAKKFRFIKVDGAAPTLLNVHAGDYVQWAQQSIQAVAPTGAVQGVLSAMTTELSNPTALSALQFAHPFGASGFLATPSATNVPPSELNLAAPIATFRRVSGAGATNVCAMPSAFKKTGAQTITVAPQNCSSDNGSADQNCYTP